MNRADAKSLLDELWRRGAEFLGCDVAIMGGAMTWVSERNLVAAISNAGGFGVLACGSMSPDLLGKEIDATGALTQRPFGVNLIVMHPQLMQLAEVCVGRRVSHVVLAGGLPPADVLAYLKSAGTKVIAFAPALAIARKLVRSGVDGLVIEGMEAGGHIGAVSTGVLAQEILPQVREVPVFVAGGIGRGEAILAFLEMGAAGVQLGTLFACATESIAHPNFKKAFIRAAARDAMPTVQLDKRFPVIPVRALINEVPATERIVTIEDAYELGLEHFAERHPDYDALQSRGANIEGEGEVTLADLTRMALRMDPDRVIVGEVRGAEAFPMLMAMSQGNNGSMCTMHADGARSVFPKLAAYVSMASTGLPVETVNVLIASAVHFVIFIENRDGRRTVASIREVVDTDGLQVMSNEVVARGNDGSYEWPFPLRTSTEDLLRKHGFQRRQRVGAKR